ncbi:MAG: hypothetical protein ACT4PL_04605 [Phycisphaerales bacterium]
MNTHAQTPPNPPASGVGLSPATVTLRDLTGHLVWPLLLRAPRLAFSPHRILLCAAAITVVGMLDSLWRLGGGGRALGPVGTFLAREGEALGMLLRAAGRLDADGAGQALARMILDAPLSVAKEGGGWSFGGAVGLFVCVPLCFAVLGFFATAVSRSVALEQCVGVRQRWSELLGFATARWKTILAATLGPPLLGTVLVALLSAAGWLLLGFDGVRVVGALLLPVFLAAGTIIALLLGGYVLGGAMIIPGISCDDADAFDAVQRAYALLFARPLLALVYGVIVGATSLLGFAFVAALAVFTLTVVARLTGTPLDIAGVSPTDAQGAAGPVIAFYVSVVRLMVGAYGLATICSGATLFFLVMRQRVDGQDVSELVLRSEDRP